MQNTTSFSQQSETVYIDKTIFGNRRDILRNKLMERNLDAMFVRKPANRFYLSGFELHDGQPDETSGFLVITSTGQDWLATDARFEQAAENIWQKENVFIYSAPVTKDLAKLLKHCGNLIGIETSGNTIDFITALKKWGAPALLPADGIVEDMRMIKEPLEIAAMRKSFALNHQMLAWLEKQIANGGLEGMTESNLAWEIEKYFRENGAEELAFASIAAFGRHAALPHAIPGNDIISAPNNLLVDIGCRVANYCSDQTRSYWLGGQPSDEFKKTLELVQRAQQSALNIMRPGIACCDVYAQARKVFEDAGVAKAFNHGLGHGIGLQTHEAPSLSPRDKRILQKGMTVTVEPGLYFPQWGGIRWEHTALIEEDGASLF